MKFLKKFWRGLVSSLKRFWDWLKKLFARKKKREEPKPDPPKEDEKPEEPEKPVVPVREEPKPEPEEVKVDDLNLLQVNTQSNQSGFIRIHEVNKFRIIQEHFQSLEHLVSCLSSRRKNQVMFGVDSSNKSDTSFSRTESYDGAVRLMRNGYTDILPRIEQGTNKSVKQLEAQYSRRKSIPISNFSGVAPNVPRYLMGLPDSMLNREVVPRKTKTLYIVYATHAAWNVSGDVFIRAGIALLSAIQLIENSGIQVKLDCIFYAGKEPFGPNKEVAMGVVPLKDYSDSLNLRKLCFPIAHPAMLRRIGFRFLETVPGLTNPSFTRSYGMVLSHSEIVRAFKTNSEVVLVSVGLIRRLNYNIESIIRYIKNAAER